MITKRWATVVNLSLLALLLAFFYVPMSLPVTITLAGIAEGESLAQQLAALLANQRIYRALTTSLQVAAWVAAITPILAILVAHTIRELNLPRLTLAICLTPLFIPGISMGIGTALTFRLLDITPSLASIITVQVLWCLPFATLIVLVALSRFSPRLLEASYMLGRNRLQSFLRVELPIIFPGVLGAARFAFILSFNETVRTAVVQGSHNTLQTYLWSQYQQVGLSPQIYQVMTLIIVLTLTLIAVLAIIDYRNR